MPFPRICKKCGERIEKPSVYQRVCDLCILKSRRNGMQKTNSKMFNATTIYRLINKGNFPMERMVDMIKVITEVQLSSEEQRKVIRFVEELIKRRRKFKK